IDIISIFPRLFEPFLSESVLGKAVARGLVNVGVTDLRRFAEDKHSTTDDTPYGGGGGMVMLPAPLVKAVESLKQGGQPRVILTTPQGKLFNQKLARELAEEEQLIIICGRYRGVDERVRQLVVTDCVSIGDYVLGGGENPAMVITEAVVRLIPGVVGNEDCVRADSFSSGLLEYPNYTRPEEFMGLSVPKVLTSGNHAEVERWRRRESLLRTRTLRSDLFEKIELSKEDKKLLEN
ncbi:MAG: tRNA (guanosine(37)-N1)-methyltransferase TrmD, partial [candidate division Zixibacteria bacterium]|nr:tRNA (guanosine(37)-N1)-methyltransferase TrmD [candidate division Zixibacteria bacterium]